MPCHKRYSCTLLAKTRKCNTIWKRAIPSWCSSKLSAWAQKQKIRNFCQSSCKNCKGSPSYHYKRSVSHYTMLKENEDKSINLTHIFLGNKGLRYLTDSPNPKIKEATVSSTQQKYCIRGTISIVMFLAIIYYVLY